MIEKKLRINLFKWVLNLSDDNIFLKNNYYYFKVFNSKIDGKIRCIGFWIFHFLIKKIWFIEKKLKKGQKEALNFRLNDKN